MVASSNTRFQAFYQALQKKGERSQAIVACLEGSLNQLQLRFPAKIAQHEVGKHLCDRLFYRMQKGLRDSIRYIYGNPTMTYTQLMVTARKAKSEASDLKTTKPLTAKSAVSSKVGEEHTERWTSSGATDELCK